MTQPRRFFLFSCPFPVIAVLISAFFVASAWCQQQLSPAAETEAPLANNSAATPAPEYQQGFQAIYQAWRNAMQRKDFAAWKAATAAYRQSEIRNRIISQKLSFPAAMFSVPVSAPQLAQLSMVNIFVKGPTATAIYFGKLNFGGGPAAAASAPDSFLVLRFAGEGDAWKFDNMRVIKFGSDSDLLLKMRRSDFSFLEDPEFQPTGVVPPVAKPVNAPDYLAELWVSSIGYQATVDINNQHQSTVVNNTGKDLVIGGINKGNNSISIKVKPDPNADPATPKHLEVAIYSAAESDQPAKRIFHYRVGEDAVKPQHSATIKVD